MLNKFQEEITANWKSMDTEHPLVSIKCLAFNQEEYIAHPDTTFVLGKETLDFNRLALAIQENASSLSATLNKCLE